MALKVTFPAPAGVAGASVDHRADLAGMFVRNSAGNPRAGLFPPIGNVVTARASMGVNVAAFQGLLVRDGLPMLVDNDGTVIVPIGAAPGANFRYDIVYVKQNESASPFSDPNNSGVLGFVSGAASADPDLTAAIAAVPSGGLPLAAVLVPFNATTTQSSGVQITQLYPFTTMAGGLLQFRDAAERGAFVGGAGQMCQMLDDTSQWRASGSSWAIWHAVEEQSPTGTGGFVGVSTSGFAGVRMRRETVAGVRKVLLFGTVQRASSGPDWGAGVDALILPTGWRPAAAIEIVSTHSGGLQPVTVLPSGIVRFGTNGSGVANFLPVPIPVG